MNDWPWRAIAVTFLAAGCSASRQVPDGGARVCESRLDCEQGQICSVDARCVRCESSGQCGFKEVCSSDTGLCVLRPGWATDCARNSECPAGQWCAQGACLESGAVSLCLPEQGRKCSAGQRCNVVNDVCEEDIGCASDSDCSTAETCNSGRRQCVPRCTSETEKTICGVAERCVKSRCVQCEVDAECAAGLQCDLAGRCSTKERCYDDRDCKVPLFCFLQTGACLPKPPRCLSDDVCGAQNRCELKTGQCVPRLCQDDRLEPNDSLAQATGASLQTLANLNLCEADIDWFQVPLSRGDELGVSVEADPFAENTFRAQISEPSGRVVAKGKLLARYVATASQPYFVSIESSNVGQGYTLALLKSRGTPCDDDRFEPNDTKLQATVVNLTPRLDAELCPQDVDWFEVSIPAMATLTVSVENWPATPRQIRLCLSNDTVPSARPCQQAAQPKLILEPSLVAQKVKIEVTAADARSAGAYRLQLEF
jgi:hypothetical protein